MAVYSFETNLLNDEFFIDVKLINNDNLIKLKEILNELNLEFTVDNLSQVIKLLFVLHLEDLEIRNNLKLIDKIKFENIIEKQDFNIVIENIQKLFLKMSQENLNLENVIKINEKLKYNDVILNEIINIGIKLYQNLKFTSQHNIDISSIIELVVTSKVEYFKRITVGNLKTMTLYDLYYETI